MSEQPEIKEGQRTVRMRPLTQYVRDLSFENLLAQRSVEGEISPDLNLRVNLDARALNTANHYEVTMKINLSSTAKGSGAHLFMLELDYVGAFQIEGIADGQMHPFLMIECPRFLFPFARRVVSDVTRDGGFPPVNLEPIDFMALYQAEAERRRADKTDGPPEKANGATAPPAAAAAMAADDNLDEGSNDPSNR